MGLPTDRDGQASGSETEATSADFSDEDDNDDEEEEVHVVTRESVIASFSASGAFLKTDLGRQGSGHPSLHERNQTFAADTPAPVQLVSETLDTSKPAHGEDKASAIAIAGPEKTPKTAEAALVEGRSAPDVPECQTSTRDSVTSSSWDGGSQSPRSHSFSGWVSSARDIPRDTSEARCSPDDPVLSQPAHMLPAPSNNADGQNRQPPFSPAANQGKDAASRLSPRQSERSSNRGIYGSVTPALGDNGLGKGKPLTSVEGQDELSSSLPILATATPPQQACPTESDDVWKEHVHQTSSSPAGLIVRCSDDAESLRLLADAGCFGSEQDRRRPPSKTAIHNAPAAVYMQGADNKPLNHKPPNGAGSHETAPVQAEEDNTPVRESCLAPPSVFKQEMHVGPAPYEFGSADDMARRGWERSPTDVGSLGNTYAREPRVEVARMDQGPRDPTMHQDVEGSPGVPNSAVNEPKGLLETLPGRDMYEQPVGQNTAPTCGQEHSTEGRAAEERLPTGGHELLAHQIQSLRGPEPEVVPLMREGEASSEDGARDATRRQPTRPETLHQEQNSQACSMSGSATSSGMGAHVPPSAHVEGADTCREVRARDTPPPLFFHLGGGGGDADVATVESFAGSEDLKASSADMLNQNSGRLSCGDMLKTRASQDPGDTTTL